MEVHLEVIKHAGDCQARIHTLNHNNFSILTTDFHNRAVVLMFWHCLGV